VIARLRDCLDVNARSIASSDECALVRALNSIMEASVLLLLINDRLVCANKV
jgi:hypothetical protein